MRAADLARPMTRAAWYAAALLAALGFLAACTADRIERGVYRSAKGYRVSLPGGAWMPEVGDGADLTLRRATPPGGMLADATCEGAAPRRSLDLLARYVVFGLHDRHDVRSEEITVDGRPAVRSTLRGKRDGVEVGVEAVVVKGAGCVYDFLYVAPVEHFEQGRSAFREMVESLTAGGRAR